MTARIYVGTYAKYSNGSIFGEWLNADDYADHEGFIEACKKLHSDESDPELMFQDYENFPSEFYHESSTDSRLWDWIDLSESEQETVAAWFSDNRDDSKDLSEIVESLLGRYESWADCAQQTTEDSNKIPDYLSNYIDWEAMGRDWSFNGDGVEFEGELFIFSV